MARTFHPAIWILPVLLALASSGHSLPVAADQPAAEQSDFGQSVIREIRIISQQLEESRQIDAAASGHKAAVYTALGLVATGITNTLLHRALHMGSPVAGLTDDLERDYLSSAFNALSVWLIPAGFSGLGIGLMSEGGSTPAITTNELKYPLAISLTTSALTTFAYTLLNSRFSSAGAGWYHLLNRAPTTVALVNSAIAMAGLTAWITWQRLDKEEQYQQLQLRLRNLTRQLQIVTSQNIPAA